jgi:hypothetical protein
VAGGIDIGEDYEVLDEEKAKARLEANLIKTQKDKIMAFMIKKWMDAAFRGY